MYIYIYIYIILYNYTIYIYIHNIYISLPVAISITRYTINIYEYCKLSAILKIFNFQLSTHLPDIYVLVATMLAPEENIKFKLSICLIF